MKKALIRLLSSIIVCGVVFTGCGKSSDNSVDKTTDSEGTTISGDIKDKTNVKDEQITIKILSGIQVESEAPLELALADEFMKENPNIKIEFIGEKNANIPTRLIAMNASNELPDAFQVVTQFASQAKEMGMLIDPSPYLSDNYKNNLVDSVRKLATLDDSLYVIPWTVQPQVLVYRSDWLEKANIDKIETMDDFRKAAIAFTNTKEDVYGFAMVGTQNGSGQARFLQFVNSFGIREVYDDNGTWKSDLTTDKYRDCLTFFTNLDLVDGVVAPGATETGYPEACNFVSQNKAGLIITGSNGVGVIANSNEDLKGKLATVAIPKQVQHCSNVPVGGYAISSQCKHPEAVAKYLEFITAPERAVPFAVQTGRLPVLKDALSSPELQDPMLKGCVDAIQYAIPQPNFADYSEVWDVMGESYNSVLSGVSIDDAMKQVEKRINAILDKNNK